MTTRLTKSGTIYGLYDPTTDELRYVGRTEKPLKDRLEGHLADSRFGSEYHVHRWVRSIAPLVPVIEPLHEVPLDDLVSVEISEIAFRKSEGARLCNMTGGGEGWISGHTPESREKMSAAKRGKKHKADCTCGFCNGSGRTPEVRQRVGKMLKGRKVGPMPEETKAKISATKKAHGPYGHESWSGKRAAAARWGTPT